MVCGRRVCLMVTLSIYFQVGLCYRLRYR